MKIMFASDIHGSAYYCNKLKNIYYKENADKLVLVGDLLYHGPRNDLPKDYNPKEVIKILNQMSEEILAVRGNCDSEVDQMVLEFPIMADYMTMFLDNRLIFVTHGHIYNNENPPKLKKGDILINGHTHINTIEKINDYIYINPGSVSIPKNETKNSYMIYEDGKFVIKDLCSEVITQIDINDF